MSVERSSRIKNNVLAIMQREKSVEAENEEAFVLGLVQGRYV